MVASTDNSQTEASPNIAMHSRVGSRPPGGKEGREPFGEGLSLRAKEAIGRDHEGGEVAALVKAGIQV